MTTSTAVYTFLAIYNITMCVHAMEFDKFWPFFLQKYVIVCTLVPLDLILYGY